MASRPLLTVLIPCFNEEANITDCLESVKWADEILVVDSFSTDKTLEIARRYTNRIIQREYNNSASQKNWAIPQAAHPWVLIVDSDERVTPELKAEILQTLEAGPRHAGYSIKRQNHFLGKPIHYCGWQGDRCTRLFLRDKGRYQDRHVHADIELEGSLGQLENTLIHYTFRSFDQYMGKFNRYATWAARDRAKRTRKVRWHHLTLRPGFRFFKQYVLKQGFRDGKAGTVLCMLAAFSVFMKYARLWEIQETEKPGKK